MARVASSGPVVKTEAWRRLLRQDPCCYCGRPTYPPLPQGDDKNDPLRWRRGTVEHLVPRRDLGFGVGLDENTVGACSGCNVGRGKLKVLDMLLRTRGIRLDDEEREAA